MATILGLTSWLFCLRPWTWFLGKVFKKNYNARAILLELHYLIFGVMYFIFAIWGISFFMMEEFGAAIALTVIGVLGTFSISYGIFHYHKDPDADMDETTHDGYDVTVDLDRSTATATERTKTSLSTEAFLCILFSPLNPLIRLINFVLTFFYLSKENYYNDLAVGCHLGTIWTTKMILLDNFYYKK